MDIAVLFHVLKIFHHSLNLLWYLWVPWHRVWELLALEQKTIIVSKLNKVRCLKWI